MRIADFHLVLFLWESVVLRTQSALPKMQNIEHLHQGIVPVLRLGRDFLHYNLDLF